MLPQLAILAFFSLTVPAFAAQPFDGDWSMSASTVSGSCANYTFDVGIVQGRIKTPGGVMIAGSGHVTPAGVIQVNFTAGSDVISASGKANNTAASGRWTAPSLACAGTWQAQKR